jgi:hypothetical protein
MCMGEGPTIYAAKRTIQSSFDQNKNSKYLFGSIIDKMIENHLMLMSL